MAESRRSVRVLIFLAITSAIILFTVFLLPHLIVLILPFIIAFFLSKVIEPAVRFLNKKLKMPKKLASGIAVVIVVGLLVWVIASIIYRIVIEISNLVSQADVIAQHMTSFFGNWEQFLSANFGEGVAQFLSDNINPADLGNTIRDYLTGYIWPMIDGVLNVAKSLPNILIFIVVLILGTYFMSSDSDTVRTVMKKMVPKTLFSYFKGIKNDMSNALVGYIRAQLILMCVTFIECTVGFVFIGGNIANYALVLGLTISVIDALPILGSGTVLIPWAIYSAVTGNPKLCVYLLILYVICLAVRQFLEPRIISMQIGIHPLLTLFSMYAGLRLIGFFGMILGPMLMLLIKSLVLAGVFKRMWHIVWHGKSEIVKAEQG